MIIKLLLLSGLCVASVLAYRNTQSARSLALRRIGLALILSAAVIGIALPGLVTAVANAVGVGRGADLVLYALVVVSVFVWVGVYRRLHDMEARFVALSRKIALDGSPQDSYTAGSSTAGDA
jgi:hypothetical protein